MSTYEFDLGIAPQITLAEARGDVAVGSWPQGTVLVKGEAEAVQTEKGLKVTATGDVQLRLPEGRHWLWLKPAETSLCGMCMARWNWPT